MNLEEFQEEIGYKFKNINLLQTALTRSEERRVGKECR